MIEDELEEVLIVDLQIHFPVEEMSAMSIEAVWTKRTDLQPFRRSH